jgi:aspartate/methionine/tyrosine aminotransferase
MASKITAKTRAIYVNSPNNPTGGVLTREDLAAVADLCRERDLWLISDEAYEDVVFDDAEHVSAASLPGMYERTIPFYTFSKSYAMTGLRLGYLAARDPQVRERMKKVLFYTASNIASVVQYGGIGALEGPQDTIRTFQEELRARRDLFYEGVRDPRGRRAHRHAAAGRLLCVPEDRSVVADGAGGSQSWNLAEHLISKGRIGCVPGVDFGAQGEGYIRFCFARDRGELTGALASMGALFAGRRG